MGNYTGTFGLKRYVGAGEGTCKEYDVSAKPAEGMYNFLEILINGELPQTKNLRTDQACIPAGAVVKEVTLVTREGSINISDFGTSKADGEESATLITDLTAIKGNASTKEVEDKVFADDRYIYAYGTASETEKGKGVYGSILVKFI